jgi:WD40 repeat protein
MLVLKPCVSGVRIDSLAFAPGGATIAAPAEHHGIMLWGTFSNGAKAQQIPLPNSGACRLAFTPDGKYLLAGNDELHAIDLAVRAARRYLIRRWATLGFAVSPDGSRVTVAEKLEGHSGLRFTRWRIPPSEESLPEWRNISECHLHSVPILLGEDQFVTFEWWSSKGVCMMIRSAESGAIISQWSGLSESPDNCVLSPDATRLACQTRGFIHIRPLNGIFHQQPEIRNDNQKHFTGIAFHPSGRYLAATSNDATVKFYDTTTWEVARTFTWDIGRMRSIAFSPDGTLAAAGSDKGKVVVWDVDL